jgi:hypothetical protein
VRLNHSGQGEQDRHQDFPIHGRFAPEGSQQGLGGEVVDHLVGVGGTDGHQANGHVADGFGQHPAHAHHHRRAELWVHRDPGDEFARGVHHGRHQHRHVAIIGAGRGQQLPGCSLNCSRVAEPEADQTTLGLVGNGVATQLGHHGEPHLGGRRRGRRRIRHHPFIKQGQPERRQKFLGGRLGEGAGRREIMAGHGRVPYRHCRARESAVDNQAKPGRDTSPGDRTSPTDVVDPPGLDAGAVRGVIEGFYGPPWSWDQRREVMAFCAERRMTHYVHAPKDDPRHRVAWREPWEDAELEGYASLVAAGTLEVGTALSPGLSIDYGDRNDQRLLCAKVDQVLATGVGLVALCLDDLAPRPGLGAAHARLTMMLADHLGDRARLVLVPTDYTSVRPTTYLRELAAGLGDGIDVAWTGPGVVNDHLTATDAEDRAAALGGRAPLVWDNYPVNDAIMADRLFTGPLRGRDPRLREVVGGWLANPGVQARASLPALASIAAWCEGDDPTLAWRQLLDGAFVGSARICEACDGEVPAQLIDSVISMWATSSGDAALEALRIWLDEAARADAPDLGAEVTEWVTQVNSEASVARTATALLSTTRQLRQANQDGDGDGANLMGKAIGLAFALAGTWPAIRRSATSVFGPRASFRPTMGQRGDGEWVWRPGALQADDNAVDRLVRFALACLDDAAQAGGPAVGR